MRLKTGSKTVLVIPDLQIPFHHKDSFKFLKAVEKAYKCDTVVCVGDEVDQYALSRYSHDPDAMSAGDEQRASRKALAELYRGFPNVVVCLSNHTDRVLKRAIEAGIPKAYLKSIKEFMDAPDGWTWDRSWDIDGVHYEHGDGIGGGTPHRTLAISNRQSTCIGHHHSSAGVEYIANDKEMIFGMNVGCLVDIETYAFAYAKTAKYKPILSCGVVTKGVPQLVPMVLDGKGRWTGKL